MEHIYGPLSDLFWRTEKCRTMDLRADAFSIRLIISFLTNQFILWMPFDALLWLAGDKETDIEKIQETICCNGIPKYK